MNGSTAGATGRAPFVSLAAVGLAAFAFAAGDDVELTRTGLARGELWRFFTGHFTHYSAYHLVVDAGTLLALGWLYERRIGSLRWALTLGTAALAISASFLAYETSLEAYRGLSGLDCAAFAAAIVAELDRRKTLAMGMTALFAAKVAWEQASGAFLFPQAGLGDMGLPVLTAHSTGALCGFAAGLIVRRRSDTRPCLPARSGAG